MRLRIVILLCAAALLSPLLVSAEEFSYRSVDLTLFPWAKLDGGSISENGNGFLVRGSLPIYRNFFALTEFQNLDLDHGVDTSRISIGGGGHWPISNTIDVVARAGIVRYKVGIGRFDDDDTGLWIGGRIRARIAPRFEVEGGVEHQHVEVAGLKNDTYLVGEARYNVTQQWSAGVLVNVGGDADAIGVQGRLNF